MHIVDAESQYFLGASILFYPRTTSAGKMIFNFSICEIINPFPERIHMGKCRCETLNFKENKYFKTLPKKNFLHHYNLFPTRGMAHFFLMYGILQDLSWFSSNSVEVLNDKSSLLEYWKILSVKLLWRFLACIWTSPRDLNEQGELKASVLQKQEWQFVSFEHKSEQMSFFYVL